MEALQILKFSIKNGHVLNFTQGMRKEDELLQMELDGTDSSSVPENLASYRIQLQQILEEDEEAEDEELGEEGQQC